VIHAWLEDSLLRVRPRPVIHVWQVASLLRQRRATSIHVKRASQAQSVELQLLPSAVIVYQANMKTIQDPHHAHCVQEVVLRRR
jgi:hypothetical protein